MISSETAILILLGLVLVVDILVNIDTRKRRK